MGYAAERAEAEAIKYEYALEKQAKLDRMRRDMVAHHIWVTSKGAKKINVKDMELSHIENIKVMFKKDLKKPTDEMVFDIDYIVAWQRIFERELKERNLLK